MRSLQLIIVREYLARVKNRLFIILTLIMPLLMIGVIAIPALLGNVQDTKVKEITVIDSTKLYTSVLKSTPLYKFSTSTQDLNTLRSEIGNSTYGVIEITDNLINNPQAVKFYTEKQASEALLNYINGQLSKAVKTNKLNNVAVENNLNPQVLKNVQSALNTPPISVVTVKIDEEGKEKETSSTITSIIGSVLSFLIYFFVLTYGAMVMQSVIEEKNSRIVEVMVSSVRPFYLMLGKIIGIGLAGFTQIAAWAAMLIIVYLFRDQYIPADASESISKAIVLLGNLNWIEIISCFCIFFVGGYLVFAALFAMFGSAVDNPQDSQQFMMPMMVIMVFALYAGMFSAKNPDGPLAFWCSMIPLTSPIVMMVRLPSGVPWYELLISILILFATTILIVKVAAKVYRVGILIYGKKPNLKELYKWLKYK